MELVEVDMCAALRRLEMREAEADNAFKVCIVCGELHDSGDTYGGICGPCYEEITEGVQE